VSIEDGVYALDLVSETTYKYDRKEVPRFWVASGEENLGVVFAESAYHRRSGYVFLGIVSKQSPFGQGVFKEFKAESLRAATSEEVKQALIQDHPDGADFLPERTERSPELFKVLLGRWEDVCWSQTNLIRVSLTVK
jgi:hypothetical protein